MLAIAAAGQAQEPAVETTFRIFTHSRDVGTESVTVVRAGDGWIVKGSGRTNAPVDLATRRFEARYDADWHPVELLTEGMVRGQNVVLHLAFKDGVATGELTQGTDVTEARLPLSPGVVLLSDTYFGAYEALAARLDGISPGTDIPVYFIRQAEIAARVNATTDERIQTPGRTIQARRHHLTLMTPGTPQAIEVWADENSRLLRLRVPGGALDVVREDIATVASRQQPVTRAGDEEIRIRASGFSLAGTLSRPQSAAPRSGLPAVVLVPGPGPQDRDEIMAGVPVGGQLAGALADAGFIVVRYDKRGIGLSGGRPESVTLSDYADDVRAVVKYLKDRKDVDDDRIAIVGYGEGGWPAVIAGSRDKSIGAVVLLATPGVSGHELVLDQQRRVLARLSIPEAEKETKIELQRKINAAVSSGKGWDDLPGDVRTQADTPWFNSLLTFDPAAVVRNLRQPLLVVSGDLDREVSSQNAERLISAGRERKADRKTEAVSVPGVNHLLVPATTGEVDEYGALEQATISPAVVNTITEWLRKVQSVE